MESSIFPKTSAWGSWKFSAWHFSPNQSKKKKVKIPNHKLGFGSSMLGKGTQYSAKWWFTMDGTKKNRLKQIQANRHQTRPCFYGQSPALLRTSAEWCPKSMANHMPLSFHLKIPTAHRRLWGNAVEDIYIYIYMRWWVFFGVCSGCILRGEYTLAKTIKNQWLAFQVWFISFPGVNFLPVQHILCACCFFFFGAVSSVAVFCFFDFASWGGGGVGRLFHISEKRLKLSLW